MSRIFFVLLTIVTLSTLMFLGCSKECEPYDDSYICDPSIPVVLNGDTIPEGRIERSAYECVTEINLSEYNLSDPNCLAGIEEHSATLQKLNIGYNRELTSIDLSPLSTCTRLEELDLMATSLTSVDISPLAECTNLWILSFWDSELESIDLTPLSSCIYMEKLFRCANELTSIDLVPILEFEHIRLLYLDYNNLDATSCEQICEFIETHPNCDVMTDCAGGGK